MPGNNPPYPRSRGLSAGSSLTKMSGSAAFAGDDEMQGDCCMRRRYRWAQQGFTLIEILIVVIIISIVTSVALVSLSQNENRKLDKLTQELLQRFTYTEEQALLLPGVLGLRLNPTNYQFVRYTGIGKDKKQIWTALQNEFVLPDNVELVLKDENPEQPEDLPQIVISTSGEVTPFTIYLGIKGKAPRYVITGEADGHVTSQSLS